MHFRRLKMGNGIDPDHIKEQLSHRRTLSQAIHLSDRALFDNSEQTHRLIAKFEGGRAMQFSPNLPGWLARLLPI